MLKKTLLTLCLSAGGFFLFAQSTDLKIEQLKQQIKISGEREGRSTAIGLAILGADYLAPGNAEIDRLIYETYYSTTAYEDYDEGYAELTFNATDWSPDGNQLAVAMSDGSIRIYDANQFSNYERISINDGGVLDVSWSPNGDYLAYGGVYGEVGYLNTSTWTQVHQWTEGDYMRAVAFSPDNKRIAAGGDENILFVYNLESKEQERAFAAHTDWIRSVSWSANGTKVAAASDDNTATVWSITQGNLMKTHRDHGDYCRDAAFSSKGDMLATVSDDLNVYIYEPATEDVPGQNLKGHENWVMAVDWSSDNRMLATADNTGGIIVHNMKNGDQTFYNSVDEGTSWMDIDFSKNNEQIAVTGGYELAIYTIGQSTPSERLTPEGVVGAEATSEASEDQLEELLSTLLTGAVGIEPSADEARMGIINESYELNVVDMKQGVLVYTIDGHEDWIRNISWSSDGRLVATASDDQMVGIWDAATGEMQQLLSGHSDWVRDVAFSPDNKVLASAGDDGVLRFWDTETGDELSSTDNIGSYLMTVNWSADQAYLAAESSENRLHVWNAKNNELIFSSSIDVVQGSAKWIGNKELEVHSMEGKLYTWNGGDELTLASSSAGVEAKNESGTTATALGTYIAVAGTNKQLMEGHNGTITALDFSPNGKYLVSQTTEGEVGLWEPATGKRLAVLNVTDGVVKPLWWSKDGSGFYIPGAPGKVELPTSSIRESLTAGDYKDVFTEEDIRRYRLNEILLSDANAVAKLKANANPAFLSAIADYYDQRAAAAQVAGINSEDAAKAEAFRAAANR